MADCVFVSWFRALFGSACLALIVTGCGGGGSAGGVNGASPIVTMPNAAPIPVAINPSAVEMTNTPALSLVEASRVYDLGLSGSTLSIGVLDSGVDASHSELAGRVIGGGDWHSQGNGTTDPYGHGTHVASIIAAASNGIGTQGITPLAEIVSYRILNNAGTFGGISGNLMVPTILDDIRRRTVPVVNNSWSSSYEITDLSAGTIESAINQELLAYRQTASADGAVMVWAAGNNGATQVSVRGGLPHYFPELEANWLTVVAVDLNGREPSYTNRCGLAAAWCVTAPGGGDLTSTGIEAAKSGGGYIKKSGTSMAAPLVSGAIGLVLEHMPNLSPRQAAIRLKETATYNGLTASNGCTIATCTETAMAEIFGHGMINLDGALQPIGEASLVNNSGQYFDGETSYITTPVLVGDAIRKGLEGAVGIARDSFDGAAFAVELAPHISTATPPPLVHLTPYDQPSGIMVSTPLGFFMSPSRDAPTHQDLPARLLDVPSPGVDAWHGIDHAMAGLTSRVMIGHGDQRSAAHLILGATHPQNQHHHWIGMGVDRSHHWLDGQTNGVFGESGSRSTWIFAGQQSQIGMMDFTAEILMGQTRSNPSSGLIAETQLTFDSWSLRLDHEIKRKTMPLQWGIHLHQPPALRQGHLVLNEPNHIDSNAINFTQNRYDLSLSSREKHLGLFGQTRFQTGMILSAGVQRIANYGHQKNRNGLGFSAKVTHRF